MDSARIRRSMGISGVLCPPLTPGRWCASNGSSALQKSHNSRCSLTPRTVAIERLFARNDSRVPDAGHAAVFLKANVLVVPVIQFLEIQHNKTVNPPRLPELFLKFFSLSSECKNLLLHL